MIWSIFAVSSGANATWMLAQKIAQTRSNLFINEEGGSAAPRTMLQIMRLRRHLQHRARDCSIHLSVLVFLAFFPLFPFFAGFGVFAEHLAVSIELVTPFFAIFTDNSLV